MVISDREIQDFLNSNPIRNWRVSATPPTEPPVETYRGVQCYFTMSIVHGGRFFGSPNRNYLNPVNHYVEFVNNNSFNVDMLMSIITSLGYSCMGFCYYYIREKLLDYGLKKLQNNRDINEFKEMIIEEEFQYVKRIFVENTPTPSVTLFWLDTLVNAEIDTIESILYPSFADYRFMTVREAKSYVKRKYNVRVPTHIIQHGLSQAKRTVATAWWNVVWIFSWLVFIHVGICYVITVFTKWLVMCLCEKFSDFFMKRFYGCGSHPWES